jgi:hypothetical protein
MKAPFPKIPIFFHAYPLPWERVYRAVGIFLRVSLLLHIFGSINYIIIVLLIRKIYVLPCAGAHMRNGIRPESMSILTAGIHFLLQDATMHNERSDNAPVWFSLGYVNATAHVQRQYDNLLTDATCKAHETGNN